MFTSQDGFACCRKVDAKIILKYSSFLIFLLIFESAFAQFEGQISQVCDGSSPSRLYATANHSSSGTWQLYNTDTNQVLGTAADGEYIESTAFSFGDRLQIRDDSNTSNVADIINIPTAGDGSYLDHYITDDADSESVGCDNQLVCSDNSEFDLNAQGFADGFSNSNPGRIIGTNTLSGTHNGSFNALIFGDYTSDGTADTEGRLAVEGNLTIPGSTYSIGIAGASTGGKHAPFGWDNLIVGGNMDFAGRMRGSVLYNNSTGGDLPGFDGIGGGATGMYRNYTPGIDWTGAQANMENLSTDLNPSNITIVHQEGSTTVNAYSSYTEFVFDAENKSGVVVFNVASIDGDGSFYFDNIGNAEVLLINVGGTTTSISNGQIYFGTPSSYTQITTPYEGAEKELIEKTLWNFYETDNLSFLNYAFLGSVLAPFTSTVSLSGGSINGQSVLSGDVQHSSFFEFHNFCFTKSSSLVPEEKTLILTKRNCWRMLSSPFQSLSYNDIIGPLWTQGATGSDSPPPETSAENSNIFLWDKTKTGNSPSDWTTSGLDLNQSIPEGEGFLMSIFEDDNYDGEIEPDEKFDKEITVTGTPYSSTNVSPSMNGTDGGWTLVGNPFDDPVDFGYMTSNGLTNELTDVAYVYNINATGENPNTNGNPGGWVSTNGSYGDHDGNIAVFQGFFVQNDGVVSNPSITFTDAARTTGATFYGKERRREKDYVRLEMNSPRIHNSAWLTFSENGSFERIKGDAYELVPFKEEYALLASKKGDEILDIGQFADQPRTEIKLHVEATTPGTYTITVTELNISSGKYLIFKDTEEGVELPVDENFEYPFTIQQTAKTGYDIEPLTCGVSGEDFAKAFTPVPAKSAPGITDRFSIYITENAPSGHELPTAVALHQNYPNPFNPSTKISYELPRQSDVQLEVFDLIGRRMATIVDETMEAGIHTVNFDASRMSSGVYLYILKTGSTTLTRKLTLIK